MNGSQTSKKKKGIINTTKYANKVEKQQLKM